MKTKERCESNKKDLLARLNKISGQINGIRKMIENDRYCGDILIQISAADNALKSLGTIILKEHLNSCVVNEIKNDNLEIIDEVIDLVNKLN